MQIIERTRKVEIDVLPGNRVSRRDGAQLIGIDPRTCIAYERRGLLEPIRVGRRVFYNLDAIKKLIGETAARHPDQGDPG